MIEPSLSLLPRGARVISRRLAVAEDGDLLVVFDASGPIYQCRRDDREGLRLAAGMFNHLGLAGLKSLGDALGMDPSTVFRSRKRFEAGGVEAVRTRKGGMTAQIDFNSRGKPSQIVYIALLYQKSSF